MDTAATLLFFIAIALFLLGVVLNIRKIIALPGDISKGIRLPAAAWLVMLIGLGQWFGRESRVEGVASVDTSATLQIASIMIAGLIMILMFGRTFKVENFKLPFMMIFLFGLEGLLTAPISDVPALSVFKSVSVLVAVLLAVMAVKPLSDKNDARLLFNTVYVYFVIIAFLSIVGGVLFPEITHRANKGVFSFMLVGWPALNSNSLSYVAAVVFVVSLRRIFVKQKFNYRMLYIGACSVGFVTLLLAQGRTSIISSTLAILFMSYSIKEMRSLKYILMIGGSMLMVIFFMTGSVGDWIGTLEEYLQRGVTDEQLTTLSGRTNAWAYSWELFLNSPITGYGFYAAGKTLLAPHNAYFTVLLNGGLLGFIPWLIGVGVGLWFIVRNLFDSSWSTNTDENNFYKEIVAVMIVQFIRTITGQDLTVHSYSMLVFLAALTYIFVRKQQPNIESNNFEDGSVEDIKDTEEVKFKSIIYRKNSVIVKKNKGL